MPRIRAGGCRMKPGMVNLFDNTLLLPNLDPRTHNGGPVYDTYDGLRGTDR